MLLILRISKHKTTIITKALLHIYKKEQNNLVEKKYIHIWEDLLIFKIHLSFDPQLFF